MKETDKKIPLLCTLSAKGYRTHLGLEATQLEYKIMEAQ